MFKLMSAVGSRGGQTVKITMLSTTGAANWRIWTAVQATIDDEGNEYALTFGRILPTVREIKLFKFPYRRGSLESPIYVEFRNIPITWE